MKLTNDAKVFAAGIVFTIIVFGFLFLSAILSGCTTDAKANIPEKEIMPYSLIKAYNNVIHKIWIDNPNYMEDVLMESDEFVELNDIVDDDWGDTFIFRNKEDSIAYYFNKLY